MGCTNSMRKQEIQVGLSKHDENRFQNLFHATTEFDLSTSDSESEHEILSIQLMNKNNGNHKNMLIEKIDKIPTGLTTTHNNLSAASSTLMDNRLSQTRV